MIKGQVLYDKTKSGKYIPWKEKKVSNLRYYELLQILEYKKAFRVRDCAEVLEYRYNTETKQKKLYRAWFCKSRLCPLCNWRRTMKHGIQSQRVITEVIRREPKARWLFLTLSVKNVYDGKDLDRSIRDMSQGFNRLIKYKKVSKNLIGYMRATEVTVNKVDNSYNQHIHVLLCVKPSYFNSVDNYITQAEWRELWKRALKIDYMPYAHIMIVKDRNKRRNDIEGAIKEVSKYPVKDTDYMTDDEEKNLKVVNDLETGLQYKRLLGYGGLLREIHKELNLEDVEDGNLINIDETNEEAEEKGHIVYAIWNYERQNYYLKG